MINKIQTKLYFISLSIFIILIDQFSKYLMIYNHKIFINKDFLLFRLDYVKNYGAAFNIFSGSRIFLSFISIIFTILLIYLILRKNTLNFINLNIINFPVFNIADISINIGFILLLYNIFKNNR